MIGLLPSAELEASIYFCCRDALVTAAARGVRPTLRVRAEEHALRLEFESPALVESGLADVRDRVEALGGELAIVREPEDRVRISASIPLD